MARGSRGRGKRHGKGLHRRSSNASIEWVGGRVSAPFYVTERKPFRPQLSLWLELPSGLLIASEVHHPDDAPSLGRALSAAMAAPMAGPPRRPTRIRVATRALKQEVRESVTNIAVRVAPTPELDEVAEMMAARLVEEELTELSYLEDGRVPEKSVAELFAVAAELFAVAPWRLALDTDLLTLDASLHGVKGACISILGEPDVALGFVLLPSRAAFDRMIAVTEQAGDDDERDVERKVALVDGPALMLSFMRPDELPERMRHEAASRGWPLARPDAVPVIGCKDADGLGRPLKKADYELAITCMRAVIAFFGEHAELFHDEPPEEPVTLELPDGRGGSVRVSGPHDAAPGELGSEDFDDLDDLERDEAVDPMHDVDDRLTLDILRVAGRQHADATPASRKPFRDHERTLQLYVPWLAYHFEVGGRTLADWYRETVEWDLSGEERAWLDAQQQAWLSVWEILDVELGRSLTLLDLLTGEERKVDEVKGAVPVPRHTALLARVVDCGGRSVLCGSHPRPLGPTEAAWVTGRVRAHLRRKRNIPVDRLRPARTCAYLIRTWESAVAGADENRARIPSLVNTDGDELEPTVDDLAFDPGDRAQVEATLASLEGVDAPEPDDPDSVYVFVHPGATAGAPPTVIGQVEVGPGSLRLETNSVRRADALRARLEQAFGQRLRRRRRTVTDATEMLASARQARSGAARPVAPQGPEADHLIRTVKEQHYARWPDEPLPALGGATPRDTVRTREGRRQVEVLLKDIEHHESRLSPGQRFDCSGLRRTLGLPRR